MSGHTYHKGARRVSGTADYIIPLGVIGLGVFALYKLGLIGSGATGGPASGLAQKLSTAGSSMANTLATSTGVQVPIAETNQLANNITAQTWLTSYYNTRGQDCFTNALYVANPGNALLGPGDAQTLYSLIHSQAGTWFSAGDFTGIQAAFQNLVQNQTDISEVAALFQANDGMDMFEYITQGNTFGNGQNPQGNNFQLVQQFVQYAIALPVTGAEA
jgi:hypothetical protein